MVCMNYLADALKSINNVTKRPKCQILRHCFKVIAWFLTDAEVWLHWSIWSHWWSQSWENCEPYGWLNKCGVISPRFGAQLKDLEIWQNNLLYPVCLVSLHTKSPTYKQVPFWEHVHKSNLFISQTNQPKYPVNTVSYIVLYCNRFIILFIPIMHKNKHKKWRKHF